MGTLLLRLAAPMQAWGVGSKFNIRQTEREPSKSAVVGLVASAMGIRRNDREGLQRLSALGFGIRVEQEGTLLRDYHIVRSAKSRAAMLSGAVEDAYLTNRYYLCDAVFLAALETDDDALLHEMDEAIRRPVFPLFLGRRACPPTLPVSLGVRPLPLRQALEQEPWQAAEWYKAQWERRHAGEALRLRWVMDAQEQDKATAYCMDVPRSFDQSMREYAFRKVAAGNVTLRQEAPSTTHDAMAEVRACT